MGNKNRNRVKKSISPFVKWGKWGGDGVKAFVYAIIFTIVGSDGPSHFTLGGRALLFPQKLCHADERGSRCHDRVFVFVRPVYRVSGGSGQGRPDDELLAVRAVRWQEL